MPTTLARAASSNGRRWRNVLVYGLLITGAVIAIVPFLWMFSWSLMTNVEVAVGCGR